MLGRPSAVKNLLAEGVDASLRYGNWRLISALDAAALMGNLGVVRALLEHGVDVNSADVEGQTVLHSIAHHPSLVDLLLCAGADIEARTVQDVTPLHLAAELKSGDAATILLRWGAATDALDALEALDNAGNSPLHIAVKRGNLATTRALLAAGADATLLGGDKMMSPLQLAAFHGRVEVIRELAWHGVDLDDAGPYVYCCTALHVAAYGFNLASNTTGVIDALVEAGASVSSQKIVDGTTPLHHAVEYVSPEGALALLRHGAPVQPWELDSVEYDCEPPLHTAARQGGTNGAAEVVDLLLRWGADESELDADGNT
ncbi:unnamed protein product, partial [Laminaria digitata]